ncbi:MAG: lipid-A-disaccharide synthase [Bacteroidales bacterium]|nr:lipid-A-disaccharide synthase [Bacteroidales bacterium]
MRYYIIAGEASGDLYGANLIRALREEDPQAEFRFWGGDAMMREAGEPVRHIRDLAIMGFVEVVLNLRTVLGNISFCKNDILAWHPDAVIGIDYPGFNLKIERWAHDHSIKAIHYISPQLWAWKKGRIKGMRRYLDRLCYILPFEQQFYAQNNMPQAVYVGHPLVEVIGDFQKGTKDIKDPKDLKDTDSRPIIALLPGSRKQELKNSLPGMLQLAKNHPEYHFVVGGMSLLGKARYDRFIPADAGITIVFDQTYQLLSQAYAAVVCSGTATLETGLFHVPQVVCYRGNAISIAIARALVGNRINHIALVDLIDDSNVVTELLQQDFNEKRLEAEFSLITVDSANREQMLEGYRRVEKKLGNAGASRRTARAIIETIG